MKKDMRAREMNGRQFLKEQRRKPKRQQLKQKARTTYLDRFTEGPRRIDFIYFLPESLDDISKTSQIPPKTISPRKVILMHVDLPFDSDANDG